MERDRLAVSVRKACGYSSSIYVHSGLSPAQAADNPELAKKIAAEQEMLGGLRARMDAFPKKEGTMYCARPTHQHRFTPAAVTQAVCAMRQISPRRTRKSPRIFWRR